MILAAFAAVATSANAAIRVVELPLPKHPLVSIRLLFQSGSADDPAGREGLAALTSTMLAEGGTKKHTYAEILDLLYPMAAGLHAYGDKDTIVFEGTVHRDNLDRFADLLAEQILLPNFSENDFSRNRQDALDALTKTLRGNDDENLGKQVLGSLMYEGHPYEHPFLGTEAGISACTLGEVRTAYKRLFTQDRLLIGIAGGYPAGFKEAFVARFAALPPISVPSRAHLSDPATMEGIRIQWLEKPSQGTSVSMGHPLSITRSDDDFYPLFLAASHLGEHRTFNGVLMTNMRQKRGLNYGDYAYVEHFVQDGDSTFPLTNIGRRQQHFEIWVRPVQPANTGFAIRHAVYELDRLIRDGIPADAFKATRNFLMNYVNLWAQDSSRRLGYEMDAHLYGKDIVQELQRRLPAMTKEVVDTAIRKHLSTKRLSIAVVGPRDMALRSSLSQGLPTPIIYDTKDTPAEVLNEDKVIERFPLPLHPKQPKILSAKHVFEK